MTARKIPPLVLLLACARLGLELRFATEYGYFRDEFYYLACARHLAWGYVDHPPFSIAVLALVRYLVGESVTAIRVVPAAVGTLVIGLTAALTKTFGGSTRAQGLAALGVLVAPEYMASSHYYSMNCFDVLFWTLAALFVARALVAEPSQARLYWILLGVVLGFGLENKLSMLFFGGGLFVGLLLSPARVVLRSKWPWVAGVLALLLIAPYAAWEQAHGWPTREFIHNATTEKMASISPLAFLHAQIDDMMPLSAPFWLAGLGALLASKRLAKFRPLGWSFVFVFVLLVVNEKSRPGYLAPAFPPLFAAGAVFVDDWFSARIWAFPAAAIVLLAGGTAVLPFALPILPVTSFIRYAGKLGQTPKSDENKDMGLLPQFYADMFGWKGLAQNVASVYEALPEDDRRDAAIYASNYGEAGAIELFGEDMGLPVPISGHNNYWLWGPHGATGKVVILVGSSPERWRERCERVDIAAVVSHSLAMPYENALPISICRNTKPSLEELWPSLKHFE
jgi:4-amino-4-deoxy-L-arabinose transferase-like glycosyltransferase